MAFKIDPKKLAGGLTKNAGNAKNALAGVADATREKASGIAAVAKEKASVAAGTAGTAITAGATAVSKKASEAIQDQRQKWYRPLFLEDYQDPEFDMPKLIVVADEDLRKGVDVCEGAIGWLNTRHVPEIIFLYEEFIEKSGVQLSPRPMCGSAYYRHPFEKNLYLQIKDYLRICKRDQLTELKNIAHKLGATHCSVEVHEERGIVGSLAGSTAVQVASVVASDKASAALSEGFTSQFSSNEKMSIEMNETFGAGAKPQRPELRWFANDYEILSLIEKRCNVDDGGMLNSYSIDITASTSSSISIDLARKIDASLASARVKVGESLMGGLKKEEKKRFIYKIEF